jgi:hypothetical protein
VRVDASQSPLRAIPDASLARDTMRWLTGRLLDQNDRRRLFELIGWALRFPAVYACSEGGITFASAFAP